MEGKDGACWFNARRDGKLNFALAFCTAWDVFCGGCRADEQHLDEQEILHASPNLLITHWLQTYTEKDKQNKTLEPHHGPGTVSETRDPVNTDCTIQGSSMIMDTLTGVLSGAPLDTGPSTFSLSFDTFKLLGSEMEVLDPPPSKTHPPHHYPTVDIRLVNPSARVKKEEEEEMEDDTLNTPVSTSADVSTFFCTDTTISDPVPITDMLDSEPCQTLRSCDALLESYRMLWDSDTKMRTGNETIVNSVFKRSVRDGKPVASCRLGPHANLERVYFCNRRLARLRKNPPRGCVVVTDVAPLRFGSSRLPSINYTDHNLPTLDHHRGLRTGAPTYPWVPVEGPYNRRSSMPMAQVDSCCRRFSPCQSPVHPTNYGGYGHGPWWPSSVPGRVPTVPQDMHYYRRNRSGHYMNRYNGKLVKTSYNWVGSYVLGKCEKVRHLGLLCTLTFLPEPPVKHNTSAPKCPSIPGDPVLILLQNSYASTGAWESALMATGAFLAVE
ncbi:uncharacterized protein NPIL_648001 [Nephila pilipes]|uniref:Uncharacterized protein n=1 Tax=Nephila pilipes TaxID=299642 RepID=A0A8X6UVG7_NEPPI|nr:uncharacterized protein NPIL_648001 [Nephila pilipes]